MSNDSTVDDIRRVFRRAEREPLDGRAIIKPDGLRTDFVGSVRMARTRFHGRRSGPLSVQIQRRSAWRSLKRCHGDSPHRVPAQTRLRLLLGSDAVKAAKQNELARIEADHKWRELSISTDFEAR